MWQLYSLYNYNLERGIIQAISLQFCMPNNIIFYFFSHFFSRFHKWFQYNFNPSLREDIYVTIFFFTMYSQE